VLILVVVLKLDFAFRDNTARTNVPLIVEGLCCREERDLNELRLHKGHYLIDDHELGQCTSLELPNIWHCVLSCVLYQGFDRFSDDIRTFYDLAQFEAFRRFAAKHFAGLTQVFHGFSVQKATQNLHLDKAFNGDVLFQIIVLLWIILSKLDIFKQRLFRPLEHAKVILVKPVVSCRCQILLIKKFLSHLEPLICALDFVDLAVCQVVTNACLSDIVTASEEGHILNHFFNLLNENCKEGCLVQKLILDATISPHWSFWH